MMLVQYLAKHLANLITLTLGVMMILLRVSNLEANCAIVLVSYLVQWLKPVVDETLELMMAASMANRWVPYFYSD